MAKYTTAQLESMQIDYGVVYIDHGELTERLLGPTRGGATFEATQTIRDIEFDGRNGKSKDMQHIDFIDAKLMFSSLALAQADLKTAMPYLTDTLGVLTCTPDSLGMIPATAYYKNVTVFGKLVSGEFKKITLYNAMNEAPTSLAMIPKGEGLVAMEVFGHWEATDEISNVDKLFQIEDVASIA